MADEDVTAIEREFRALLDTEQDEAVIRRCLMTLASAVTHLGMQSLRQAEQLRATQGLVERLANLLARHAQDARLHGPGAD
jgi:predicted component of type VI protein secretion system